MNKTTTLGVLAALISAEIKGDPSLEISGLATLDNATKGNISFCVDKHAQSLEATQASAVIVSPRIAHLCPRDALIVDDPYLAYAKISQFFAKAKTPSGIAATAIIDPQAHIDPSACIANHAVINKGAIIGAHVYIGPGCMIGEHVQIGEGGRLVARVTVYDNVKIGERCVIHAGAVIGSDGFGFAEHKGEWFKIEQLGSVVIGNDVEIGSNTTIDRGALNDTIIGNGVKLDNLIQIAHNVVVGDHTAIAGHAGVAGSTVIGRYCRIGGFVAINGHLNIADHVYISGMSMVTRSIHKPGLYSSGIPARPNHIWKKNVARFQRLGTYFQQNKSAKKLDVNLQEEEND